MMTGNVKLRDNLAGLVGRRLLGAVAVLPLLACAAFLGGCDADKPSSRGSEPQDVQATVAVPQLSDATGIAADLSDQKCTSDADALQATGSVKNSSDKAKDIVVTASWTGSGDQVIASGNQTVKQLAPGKSANYTIIAVAADGQGEDLTCVVGAQAGTLAE